MGGHRLVGRHQRGIKAQPQRLGRSSAQAVQVFPALAQGLDGIAVRFGAELGAVTRAFRGAAGRRQREMGKRQAGQGFGLVHQVFTRPATAPLLPAFEAGALGLQGLAALVQAVRQRVAGGSGKCTVKGLQPGLQMGQLAVGGGRLGVLQQHLDGLALGLALGLVLRRVGGRGGLALRAAGWGQRQRGGPGRHSGCVGVLPLRKALVQLACQGGVGQCRQRLPAGQGCAWRGWCGCVRHGQRGRQGVSVSRRCRISGGGVRQGGVQRNRFGGSGFGGSGFGGSGFGGSGFGSGGFGGSGFVRCGFGGSGFGAGLGHIQAGGDIGNGNGVNFQLQQPCQPGIHLDGQLHRSIQRRTLGRQRRARWRLGQQGLQRLGGGHGITGLALCHHLRQRGGPGGQCRRHVGTPALRLLLQVVTLAHGAVELLAQAGKVAAAISVQQPAADGLPSLVQLDQVVERHIGGAQQCGDGADQPICSGAGLTSGHHRVQPLAGHPVHPPVVAAEVALRLAQRSLALQRLHRRQLGGDCRGILGDAQQRAVVTQRGLHLWQPLGLDRVGLAHPVVREGLPGLALVGLGGRGGLGWCCLGGCGQRVQRRRGATFLEKPAQHGVSGGRAAGRVGQQGAVARQPPARGAV